MIPERHRRIDRQTEGRTDGLAYRIAISISRVTVLTRDNNRTVFAKVMLERKRVKFLSRVNILTRDIDIANLNGNF